MKIAIIGAGIFGITAAIKLSKFKDFNVDVFEKCNRSFKELLMQIITDIIMGFITPEVKKL